jgi:hypothetical protein
LPTQKQAHLKTARANACPKFLKELASPTQKEKQKIFQRFTKTKSQTHNLTEKK